MLWAVMACLKSKAGDHDWMCSQNNIKMGAAELDPEPALEVKTGAINLVSRQPWNSADVLSEARRTTTKNSHRIRALSCCSREALYQSNYEREMQSSGTAAQQEEYASNKHDTNRHLAAGGRPEMSLSKGICHY